MPEFVSYCASLVLLLTAVGNLSCSTEHDGLVAAYQHAVFHVVAQATRQHCLFDVAAITHQVVYRVAMVDAHGILLDDRPGVQFFGNVMASRADEFDAAQVGLMVGLGTDERRQEAVVDVDDAAGKALAQHRRQDLHVARQHHGVAAMLLEQRGDLVEGGGLVGHVDMDERDAMPLDETAQILVVGDHTGNIHLQFATAPAMQQVVEAMVLLAHQYHQALLDRRVGQLPGHLELVSQRRKPAAELVRIERQGIGAYFLAHEEVLSFLLGVVTRLDDKTAMLRDESAYRGDNARAVWAGDGQGIAAKSGHAVFLNIDLAILTDNGAMLMLRMR